MKQESFRLRPTALWIIFGPVLGCMLLAAINYSNNLVYAILYLIAALSFISIFHTWRNLAALRVEHIRILPAFAGEAVRMEIYLRNPSRHTIYGLFFARLGDETGLTRRPIALRTLNNAGVRIEPGDSCCAEVVLEKKQVVFKWGRFTTVTASGSGERRGMYRFETLLVKSSYPFGLFGAAFRAPVNVEYYIYPQPKGNSDWPELHPSGEQGSPVSLKPGDDFSGVRAYLPGESLRHVDWKAYARGRPLSVKQFTGGAGHELWLDAAEMSRLPLEARLSQLALWIVNAEKAEIPYALKLGRTTLPLGLGAAHSRRVLEALAVAGVGSASA
ncbi:MAG TPA: DUF58 domain-containing protein [Candidatus Methylacidiphilales bacterium]|jgi:uncharacterized protein (DUF58 family)|nr:DUF58 domain-containing protein [Candidatus Methylacidiphilales bacterium]